MGSDYPDDVPIVVGQLQAAETPKDRAFLLLQMPQALLLKYRGPLTRVCINASFYSGVYYLDAFACYMHCTRENGLVPGQVGQRLQETQRFLEDISECRHGK